MTVATPRILIPLAGLLERYVAPVADALWAWASRAAKGVPNSGKGK